LEKGDEFNKKQDVSRCTKHSNNYLLVSRGKMATHGSQNEKIAEGQKVISF